MEDLLEFNNSQLITLINDPISEVDIWGRGTGKSFIVGWEMNNIIRKMPRSITSITGRTYSQLLTRTLPSSFKLLEKLGHTRYNSKTGTGTYVINEKPPPHFHLPYEKVLNYNNYIAFSNGAGFLLLSQERIGSARGPNVDREIVDEALTINKERYDQETSPTNRANLDIFGPKSKKHVRIHRGFRYVSSMPYLPEQKWLLAYADYYEQEAKIQIFEVWNRIVRLQLELISAAKMQDRKLFTNIWNETMRLRNQITPFTSKDGILFTLANAFDNIKNLGLSYIIKEYDKQPLITFMIEILNWIIDRIENCYYQIDTQRHVYYNALNEQFIQTYALNTNYDFNKLENYDSRFDLDCDPRNPIEITPDWGAKISLFVVSQNRNFNFVTGIAEPVSCFINEFFVKPEETKKVMIDELVDQFCSYYKHHIKKEVVYFRDRYGDHRQPNAKSSKPYNQQAIERFEKNGWRIQQIVHKGMEPPQHEKYLLWANILKGDNPAYPKVIFNGKNCKYTLISMNNTSVRENKGKFEKDKRSEQRKSILPEEATHFSDAVDKNIWTKFAHHLHRTSTFVDPRF